jgi:hypothetical protein
MAITSMAPCPCPTLEIRVRRIYNEYLEMPGLRLTCNQAQRLWGLEAAACEEALGWLISAGFLRRTAAGLYARRTDVPFHDPRGQPVAAVHDAARMMLGIEPRADPSARH